MGTILDWSSNYPATVDNTVSNFPTLTNNVHDVRASHVNELAKAVVQVEGIQQTHGVDITTLQSAVTTLQTEVAGLSGGSSNTFVFDSGASPAGNIYNNANTLLTALESVNGPAFVELRSDITIAGAYTLKHVIWMGVMHNNSALSYSVKFANTSSVTVTERMVFDKCFVDWSANTVVSLHLNNCLIEFNKATCVPNAAVALWTLNTSAISIFYLDSVDTTTLFGNVPTGTTALLMLEGVAYCQTNAFTGAGSIYVYTLDSAAYGPPSLTGTTGAYALSINAKAANIAIDSATGLNSNNLQTAVQDMAGRLAFSEKRVLIFDPSLGVASPGRYITAASLMAALDNSAQSDGPIIVQLRQDITLTGTHTFDNVSFVGTDSVATFPMITFDVGCSITVKDKIHFENVFVSWNATTAPYPLVANASQISFKNVELYNSATFELIHATGNSIIFVENLTINRTSTTGLVPYFCNINNGITVRTYVKGTTVVYNGAFTGLGTAEVHVCDSGVTIPVGFTPTVVWGSHASNLQIDAYAPVISAGSTQAAVRAVADKANKVLWSWNRTDTTQFDTRVTFNGGAGSIGLSVVAGGLGNVLRLSSGASSAEAFYPFLGVPGTYKRFVVKGKIQNVNAFTLANQALLFVFGSNGTSGAGSYILGAVKVGNSDQMSAFAVQNNVPDPVSLFYAASAVPEMKLTTVGAEFEYTVELETPVVGTTPKLEVKWWADQRSSGTSPAVSLFQSNAAAFATTWNAKSLNSKIGIGLYAPAATTPYYFDFSWLQVEKHPLDQ